MKNLISQQEESFDNFLRNKQGRKEARERRKQRRALRMRRREARTRKLELDADSRVLDNKAKDVQVGLTSKLADEATAPVTAPVAPAQAGATGTPATPATGAPATGAPATTATPSKMPLIIGSGIALLLIVAVIFFLVKK